MPLAPDTDPLVSPCPASACLSGNVLPLPGQVLVVAIEFWIGPILGTSVGLVAPVDPS